MPGVKYRNLLFALVGLVALMGAVFFFSQSQARRNMQLRTIYSQVGVHVEKFGWDDLHSWTHRKSEHHAQIGIDAGLATGEMVKLTHGKLLIPRDDYARELIQFIDSDDLDLFQYAVMLDDDQVKSAEGIFWADDADNFRGFLSKYLAAVSDCDIEKQAEDGSELD